MNKIRFGSKLKYHNEFPGCDTAMWSLSHSAWLQWGDRAGVVSP